MSIYIYARDKAHEGLYIYIYIIYMYYIYIYILDVGRLVDFLEDAKLWIEPVMFNVLSFMFPSIRWWNEALINKIVASFTEGRFLNVYTFLF